MKDSYGEGFCSWGRGEATGTLFRCCFILWKYRGHPIAIKVYNDWMPWEWGQTLISD